MKGKKQQELMWKRSIGLNGNHKSILDIQLWRSTLTIKDRCGNSISVDKRPGRMLIKKRGKVKEIKPEKLKTLSIQKISKSLEQEFEETDETFHVGVTESIQGEQVDFPLTIELFSYKGELRIYDDESNCIQIFTKPNVIIVTLEGAIKWWREKE